MAKRTPPLYATGSWKVAAPFTVKAGTNYSCHAIRSLADLEALGVNPYEEYYLPVGISEETYREDRKNLPNIVTLMSDTAPTLYVPDTYITSYPALDIIPYRHLVLSVSLGPVPDTLAFGDLKVKMREMVTNSIGVDSEVEIHQAGFVAQGVTTDQHQIYENARKAKMQNNATDRSKVLSLEQQVDELQERNALLEQVLIDNGLLD